MAQVDDAVILKRAKAICAKSGFFWEFQRSSKPSLDQDGRRKYLALAREQLLDEGDERLEARAESIAPARSSALPSRSSGYGMTSR
jgi:hypothetical protein